MTRIAFKYPEGVNINWHLRNTATLLRMLCLYRTRVLCGQAIDTGKFCQTHHAVCPIDKRKINISLHVRIFSLKKKNQK